ncbi:MAG: response regulator [Rhodospirillaceae bacterium]|nr:response regulator [Rhodospirillaceae bacterium]
MESAPKRILVVEDEVIVAIEIAAILTDAGYAVVGPVGTAVEAFKAVLATPPDLVLMDICLPGLTDGIGAAGAIRGQTSVPVVYVTANTDLHLMERVVATKPAGFVQKPFTAQELLQAVEAALRQTPVS